MIRVCLVEDQTIVRQGLRTLLALVPDIEVVAEASDGIEAAAIVLGAAPDVVLLDLRMPGRDGIAVLGDLAAAGSLPPTIVLTTFDDDALLLAAVRAGAKGYLLKDVSLERLAGARARPPLPEPGPARSAHASRDGGAAAAERWLQQPRDRGRARKQRGHGQEPGLQHSVEARSARPDPCRAQSDRGRPLLRL